MSTLFFSVFTPIYKSNFVLSDYQNGLVYEPIAVNAQHQLISQVLGLGLQPWQGRFRDIEATWLRWATIEGELLPLDRELVVIERDRANAECQRADAERQRAEAEHQRAEAERQRAERLAAKLRELNIDPDIRPLA